MNTITSMTMKTMLMMTVALAAGPAGCVDADPETAQSRDLTFAEGSVHVRAAEGDQVIAEVSDLDGALQATLVWDTSRGLGVLDDQAAGRSEQITLDDAQPLALELVGEIAYQSWIGDEAAGLRYGDCYYAGTYDYGVECCWGNRGWNCITWY